jgi:pimeloyl-ACP methyl ester carboxylesterase
VACLYRSSAAEEAVRQWCEARLAAWGTPHRTSWVETGLGRTHLVRLGEGRETCLFLPGTNFNAATSLSLLSALAQRFTVYAADLPGQPGLSAAGRPPLEREGYAAWVDEVVTHVRAQPRPAGELAGPAPVVLLGHSRGAAVALSARPGTVAGIVLVCPAGLCRVRVTPRVLAATLPWLVRPSSSRSARLVRVMSGPSQALPDAPAHARWLTLVARATRTTGAPGPLPADVLARWRDHATVVLAGAEDVFFPPARLRPRALEYLGVDPVVVAGTGHLLTEQDPTAVVEAVATVATRCRTA